MGKHLGVDIMYKQSSIHALIIALLAQAKKFFPRSKITCTVTTHQPGTILKIKHGRVIHTTSSTHGKIVNSEYAWAVIVPLTTKWKTDDGKYYNITPKLLEDVMEFYRKLVDDAKSLRLINDNVG